MNCMEKPKGKPINIPWTVAHIFLSRCFASTRSDLEFKPVGFKVMFIARDGCGRDDDRN